jgi:uncharacterized phage protein gp47/JayE
MTFRAEPFGVFVDDMVSAHTGGITRETFRFLPENEPYRLGHPTDVLAETVRIHGLLRDEHHRFVNGIDFDVVAGTVVWRPAPASVPDEGSYFYASYERTPDPQAPPRLTDRNPGSILRTLAESFAREYAVLSRQLQQVYDGAFIETAEGRDLDQLVTLLGLSRRTAMFAIGEVVFSRTTPAPGDITIEAGTQISTSDVPGVTVTTTESRTLRTGTLSVSAPVAAAVPGAEGIAAANTLTVIHRPILGVSRVTNPEPTAFRGESETDVALRRRARLALQTAGKSTTGAIVGALATVEGIRDQDVYVVEDHIAFPGVVKVTVAATLDEGHTRQAIEQIDKARPAGVRVLHNLVAPPPPVSTPGPGGGAAPGPPPTPVAPDGVFSPVGVKAAVTPVSGSLRAEEREALVREVEQVVESFVNTRGVGEPVIYNQLVAAVMAVAGVQDVVLDVTRHGTSDTIGRQNLFPDPPNSRPRLDLNDVTLRGAPIALDVTVTVERKGLAAAADRATALHDIEVALASVIPGVLPQLTDGITTAKLLAKIPDTDTYEVESVSYAAEFVDEGLRIIKQDLEITPAADQVPWIRTVNVTEKDSFGGDS